MPLQLEIEEGAHVEMADVWAPRANGIVRVARGGRLHLGSPIHIEPEATKLDITIGSTGALELADGCYLGGFGIVCPDGSVSVGAGSTFNVTHFRAFEGRAIKIGRDCMFAEEVEIDTTDYHAIYDLDSHAVINSGKDVIIGDHVWVSNVVTLLKGTDIGSGSVIGARSVVTGFIAPNSVAAGTPAKVIRSNIGWSRTSPEDFNFDLHSWPR